MTSSIILPFGRYAGWPMEAVPLSYLQWAIRNAEEDSWLFNTCLRELTIRRNKGKVESGRTSRKSRGSDYSGAQWLQHQPKGKRANKKKLSKAQREKARADRKRWASTGYNDEGERVLQDGQFAGWTLVGVRENVIRSSLSGLLSEEQITEIINDRRQLVAAAKELAAGQNSK